MKRKIRIAIYSGEISSTTFIERLIRGVADSGHAIFLFGALNDRPSYPSEVRLISYKLNRLSKLFHLMRFSILLTLFRTADKKRLNALLKAQKRTDLYTKVKCYPVLWHKPDIFHVQWAKGLADWVWVKEFGIKLVLSLRGAHINYSPIADEPLADMYRFNFPKVDGFHAVSEAIGCEAQKYGAIQEKIHVVYSGLPLDTEITITKKDNKIFQIISVGRPHWKKGYSYALDACKFLKAAGLQFEYTIIGAANTIEYQYHIADLGLENHVRLVGQQSFEQVQNWIQESDLLILPSVEEGIANVVLEAMSWGTLVLSADCGGMREVVTDGKTGFLVPIRDVEALADAVMRIQKLPVADVLEIRKRARMKILEQHSEEGMVTGMLSVYYSLFCK
ncbi:glycosyltransferase family 4 protein [Bizionia psychrotolerans]|uniref:glycosyltransferase family 4 protein n=1 Tax=Bizionia psychrotolerans TaxID=1492901 RepID=UPI0006524D74|nr:glycosyltransferase family 4 protein [Bizionia psychrotolerans]